MTNVTWQESPLCASSGGCHCRSNLSETVFKYHGNGNGWPALADTALEPEGPAFVAALGDARLLAVAHEGIDAGVFVTGFTLVV